MDKQKIYVLKSALEFTYNSIENKEWIVYYITCILERQKFEETLKDKYITNKLFLNSLDKIFHSQAKYFKDKTEIKRRVIEKNIFILLFKVFLI